MIRIARVGLALTLISSTATALTLDDFADSPTNNVSTSAGQPTQSDQFVHSGALGGERDVTVTHTVSDPTSASFGSGIFQYSEASDGTFSIVWDGIDGSSALDPDGLGGIDLTLGGNHSGISIPVLFSFQATMLELVIHSDATRSSLASFQAPIGSGTVEVDYLADFSPLTGGGADFSSVGAVEFRIQGLGSPATDLQFGGAQGAFETMPIPEPSQATLLGLGLAALAYRRRASQRPRH